MAASTKSRVPALGDAGLPTLIRRMPLSGYIVRTTGQSMQQPSHWDHMGVCSVFPLPAAVDMGYKSVPQSAPNNAGL